MSNLYSRKHINFLSFDNNSYNNNYKINLSNNNYL